MNLQLPAYSQIGEVRRWFLPLPPAPRRGDAAIPTPRDGATDADADASVDVLADAPVDDQELEYYRVAGRFIGYGSSWTDNHWDHGPDEYVQPGRRCNACRWFELRLFRELSDAVELVPGVTPEQLRVTYDEAAELGQLGDYVVYKAGLSSIPGEVPYCRYDVISSPFEVVEALTTRKHTPGGPIAFITKPSALALASAARYDDELQDAYLNRAVS
jgi:hypothetical protein